MSKDPGYSDSKRDALESKVRQYQSTILELQEQVLVLGKLKAENAKLRECLKACPILGEVHRDSNDRFKEWNLEYKYILKELEDR